jgi:hypothetical protein
VPVVDTAEQRWFAAGHAPAEVVAWFSCDGSTGTFEERKDTYRIDGRADIGVKRRFGQTLELKRRTAVGPPVALTTRLAGPIEDWRRWSPADGLVDHTDRESWIEVTKAVLKRRFSPLGDELTVSPGLPVSGGCDVELAAITVGSVEAWSFALAAFGPPAVRHGALAIGWAALVSGRPCPDGFETSFESCVGYPGWLAQLAIRDALGGMPVSPASAMTALS